ncbi:hypothetical protein LCGC14_0405030 [marine sediment metagenome]|uniref:Uncharacterized protein n=1 Tax=marine sediment metagenome TaxID=412755 RepID=A0A0F9T134_9ZZZZ
MTSLCGFNPSTPPVPIGQKGVADGVATLDSGGKIPESQIPSSVLGALKFQGTWNANTNTPTLASGVGEQGDTFIVSEAGTTPLDGITDWEVNDFPVFNGTVWLKIDNSELVTSVNGQTGAVSLSFLNLTDTPAGYGSVAALPLKVNATTDGVEVSSVLTLQRINTPSGNDFELFDQSGSLAIQVRSLDGNVGIGGFTSDNKLFVSGDAQIKAQAALDSLVLGTFDQATQTPKLSLGAQLAGSIEAFVERDNDGVGTTSLRLKGTAGITFDSQTSSDPFTFNTGALVVNNEMKTTERWVFEKYFGWNNVPANIALFLSFNNSSGFPRAFTPDKKGNVNRFNVSVENDAAYGDWTTGTVQFQFNINSVAQHTTATFTKAQYDAAATGILGKNIKVTGLDVDFLVEDEVSFQVITSATFNGIGIDLHVMLFGFYDNT